MNFLERIVIYNYKIPYLLREFLHQILFFIKNKNRFHSYFFKKNSITKEVQMLNNDGIVFLDEDYCPDAKQLKEMNLFLDKIDKERDEDTNKKKISYQTDIIGSYGLFLSLVVQPHILSTVSSYLGALPKIAFLKAWKVNPGNDDQSEMSFHMDHHGHRFLKVFWYLNDVDVGCGHHEFVKDTHYQPRLDKRLLNESLSVNNQIIKKRQKKGSYLMDNTTIESCFKDNLVKINGKAGSGFIEDTRGLHRGTPMPKNKHRIIYQALYVPYITYKDKGLHKIKNKNAFNKICEDNPKNVNIFKSVFSEII